MENTTLVSQFVLNDRPVYVKILLKPNEDDFFSIRIYEDSKSWSGRFSHELARKHSERVVETEEEYYENVMKGLTKHPDFSYGFVQQSDDSNSASFSWKKKLGSAVLVHGSVPVHRDEVRESKDTLLDILIHENQELKNKVDSVDLRNKALKHELEKCMKSLDTAVEAKEASEEVLYGKFVKLLNAKKKRILVLEEAISKIS